MYKKPKMLKENEKMLVLQ